MGKIEAVVVFKLDRLSKRHFFLIENVFILNDVAFVFCDFDNIGLRLLVFENFSQLTLFPSAFTLSVRLLVCEMR